MTRFLLIAGAVLLIATAAFHASGLPMVSGWLPGQKGQILGALWIAPVIDWSVVAVIWIVAALKGGRAWALAVAIAAIIPASIAIALFAIVGVAHPGPIMLAVAVALALGGAWRMRHA